MVSIKRAEQCIGRRVRHTNAPLGNGTITGKVVDVTINGNIRIETKEGEKMVCDPENLVWDDRNLSLNLVTAIANGDYYEDGQVGYDVEWVTAGVIYSTANANDDYENHSLYVVLPLMRKVHLVSPIADPQFIWALEEALGWAEP